MGGGTRWEDEKRREVGNRYKSKGNRLKEEEERRKNN